MAADSEAALAMPAATEAEYRNLVAETGALFGSRHYRDYHFLLTLSDDVAHFGLEHHESSDDRVEEKTMIDDTLRLHDAGPAAARVHPFVERKIPAARRSCYARLSAAHAR